MANEHARSPQEHALNPDALKAEHYPRVNFPDAAWSWFLSACEDIELPVDEHKRPQLEGIYSHLVGVNQWLNLTRIVAPLDYLKFHVFDSLSVCSLVETYSAPGDLVLDLGSGGGYPGLPLMTWLPDRRWVLVDSRARKVAFLQEAIKLSPCQQAQAHAFRGREVASQQPELHQQCQIVTARAVGPAAELLPDAAELLALNGILILLKGPSYPSKEREDFLQALPNYGFMLMEEHPLALDEKDPDRWVVLALKAEHGLVSKQPRPSRQKARQKQTRSSTKRKKNK
jgi:16S rRNA (guanine527-N7)-methyltransferase